MGGIEGARQHRGFAACAIVPFQPQQVGKERIGAGIGRVELDRLFIERHRLGLRGGIAEGQRVGLEHAFIGGETGRRLAPGAFRSCRLETVGKGGNDGADKLVLNGEDLRFIAVEALARGDCRSLRRSAGP